MWLNAVKEVVCSCSCSVCNKGFHIFCNRFPHGTEEEAVRWFVENAEKIDHITPITESAKEAVEKAKQIIQRNKPEDV